MRRREILAGIGSVGALVAGGVIAANGLPSMDDQSDGRTVGADGSTETPADGETEEPTVDPITIETIDAPGSEAGEARLPASGWPTFIDFFGTWCPPCEAQMPDLVEVHDRVGNESLFISVTTEDVGGGVSEQHVVDWWDEHDGNWTVGIDSNAELATEYNLSGFPYAVAIDADGTVQWSEPGRKTADELIAGIEQAL
jgi:thiol-disulfide isomerase/thioredoxin